MKIIYTPTSGEAKPSDYSNRNATIIAGVAYEKMVVMDMDEYHTRLQGQLKLLEPKSGTLTFTKDEFAILASTIMTKGVEIWSGPDDDSEELRTRYIQSILKYK